MNAIRLKDHRDAVNLTFQGIFSQQFNYYIKTSAFNNKTLEIRNNRKKHLEDV